ncbi:uncharacterized protein LOC134693733 [Mytilus trossulus]|uniref:uncharacterized protein LOC134693733 n=1 Tax=Mytilus trossulus TaxID=6551 RepID=UPI0030070956
MTLEMCTESCHGHRYLGLQNSNECFCGDSLGDPGVYKKKNENQCNKPCLGNSAQMCGDAWRNSVHEFITATIPPTIMTTGEQSTVAIAEMTTKRQSVTTAELITLGQSEITTTDMSTQLECLCPCSTIRKGKWDFLRGMNLTLDQLREVMKPELDLMKKKMSVNKSNTTRMHRSKISASDDRISATSVGYVGVVFICLITVCIVFIDILGCFVAKLKRHV